MAKIITPVFRGSFVHLKEPKAPAPEADPVYSMSIVLPKDDPDTKPFMTQLKKNCNATAKEKFGDKVTKIKYPWKDGDEEERDEWAGCWVIAAKSKSRPGVVGPDLKPVMDPELLYSGAYYRASVSEWGWSHPTGGKGISLNLDNVMWVKDGESFSGRASAEDDFSDFASANDETEDEVDFG
jgi:hypothetical protein